MNTLYKCLICQTPAIGAYGYCEECAIAHTNDSRVHLSPKTPGRKPKLTNEQGEKIRGWWSAKMIALQEARKHGRSEPQFSYKDLAKLYGVSEGLISHVAEYKGAYAK